MKPDGEKYHEDVPAVEMGGIEKVGFLFPLVPEFVGDLFEE